MLFVTSHYGIAQSVASVLTLIVGAGALAGVYLGGRTADRMLGRGRLNARVVVPAVTLFGVVVTFAPFGGGSHGLEYTFLTFLIVLIIAGAPALIAIRTYPRDVATAAESYRRQPITEAS